jgi:putative membrane protein
MSGKLFTVAAALGGLTLPVAAWAQQQRDYGYHWHDSAWHGGWLGMILGPLMMIAFIAAIVVVVVLLVRWIGGSGAQNERRTRQPLDILDERFARGEIDSAEYEERSRILRGD